MWSRVKGFSSFLFDTAGRIGLKQKKIGWKWWWYDGTTHKVINCQSIWGLKMNFQERIFVELLNEENYSINFPVDSTIWKYLPIMSAREKERTYKIRLINKRGWLKENYRIRIEGMRLLREIGKSHLTSRFNNSHSFHFPPHPLWNSHSFIDSTRAHDNKPTFLLL